MFDVIIIGGGAGGFFTAINLAEKYPEKRILILEKSKEALTKVRISGGGRCNVTNGEFSASELVKNYPRGEKELLSVFHKFGTKDTIEWFEKRGVPLKTEADGRVFPKSDSSSSIVNCFLNETKKRNITIEYQQLVNKIVFENESWKISTQQQIFHAEKLVIATGSNPKIWNLLSDLGHTIVPPVPSLFTFNTKDNFITDLAGVATLVKVSLLDENYNPLKIKNKRIDNGGIIAPLLITHWGFSGPAILKSSAWGARILAEKNYRFVLQIHWLASLEEVNLPKIISVLQEEKHTNGRKLMQNHTPFELPKRLWIKLLEKSNIAQTQQWSALNKIQMQQLSEVLHQSRFVIDGKSTFKEEFVTAGGISLKEIDFKTFGSKILPNVYFTGEILDIDAITGGFNFQNAWSGGFIISQNIFR